MESLTAHDDAVSAVCVRGENLLSSSWDSSVKLWRALPGGKYRQPPVADFLEHDAEVRGQLAERRSRGEIQEAEQVGCRYDALT
jgi:hypothetical protein